MSRTRRGRGEGSVYQRSDGRWVGTLDLGLDAVGKRDRRSVSGATKKEVLDKLEEIRISARSNLIIRPEKETVAEYLTRWIQDSVERSVRRSTYLCYESMVRVHLIPRIGRIQLAQILPAHVDRLYAMMAKDGVSPRMQRLAHAVLNRALGQAEKRGEILRNPCVVVDKPRVPKKEAKFLNEKQVEQLLTAAKGDRLEALYVVAVTTGLRQGELLGLHWENVNLGLGTITVVQALLEHRGYVSLGEPKSAAGRRTVVLPKVAIAALTAHRERMAVEGHTGPWVFCDTGGGPIRKSNLRQRSFEPLLKKAGLPHIRFHDLRHTAATLMLSVEPNAKVLQERMGHSSVGVTFGMYGHLLPTLQAQAVDKLDGLFNKMDGK